MRILVTGGTGLIGWTIVKVANDWGFDVAYTYKTSRVNNKIANEFHLDIRDEERVRNVIKAYNPEVVIHAAAATDADWCEDNPQLASVINVSGTENIIDACEKVGSKLVFFSSSFVFSGNQPSYKESEKPNPINHYGTTKAKAERRIAQSSIKSLIIRTDQPYHLPNSWQNHTMISWILNSITKDGPLLVFEDWYNTPIFTTDLAQATLNLATSEKNGIYHIVGDEYISRYDWAKQILAEFDIPKTKVTPTNSRTADLPAERPNTHLTNGKIKSIIDFTPRSIEEALAKIKRVGQNRTTGYYSK